MHQIELKLAEWHRLYKELQQARESLNAARLRAPMDQGLVRRLEAELERLRARSDEALDALHSTLTRQ